MKPEELFEVLKAKFNDSIIELNTAKIEPFIEVKAEEIEEISYFLRDEENLLFDNLMVLSGVDDANGAKEKDADGDTVINGGTLSVYYHIESTKLGHKLVIRTAVPRENPVTLSVEAVWKSADWHEREAYDMFGIKFLNHPNLERILMPYDWPDIYPLRKDYKSPEFYSGLKIPY